MERKIVKDIIFLSKKCVPATKEDEYIINDLIDTIKSHKDTCVGIASNMIGYNKNIICIMPSIIPIIMINPKIISKTKPYNTEESCLSLEGTRPCLRHKEIKVEYLDINFNKQINTYTDFIAEIIEHEIDHLNGVII